MSRRYRTVHIAWFVASYDTRNSKRWLNSNPQATGVLIHSIMLPVILHCLFNKFNNSHKCNVLIWFIFDSFKTYYILLRISFGTYFDYLILICFRAPLASANWAITMYGKIYGSLRGNDILTSKPVDLFVTYAPSHMWHQCAHAWWVKYSENNIFFLIKYSRDFVAIKWLVLPIRLNGNNKHSTIRWKGITANKEIKCVFTYLCLIFFSIVEFKLRLQSGPVGVNIIAEGFCSETPTCQKRICMDCVVRTCSVCTVADN